MSRAVKYFRLQLKRFFRPTPAVIVLSALLLGILGTAFCGMFSAGESDERNSLINLGIVGDTDDSYLGMAINALQNLDSSRFSISVKTIADEAAAEKKLKRGELAAYIVMPDNFISEAISGNMQKITCVTSSGASDFGARITEELMKTVTEIVANSQKAVYGYHRAALDNGVSSDRAYDQGNAVALDEIGAILSRESAYEIVEVGTSGANAIDDPILCGVLVLLLMLWGITCCTIFTSRSTPLSRVLSSKGTGAVAQVLGEYLAYLLFMIAILAAPAVIFVIVSRFLPAMSLFERYDFTRLFPGILVPIITIAAMQFFLYEAAGGMVSGVLLQFFCAMGLGYISGCVYPAYFFPRQVQDAAAWLPAWNCRLWLDELLAGVPSFKTSAVLIAYLILFLLLSVLIRRMRIKRKGGGA